MVNGVTRTREGCRAVLELGREARWKSRKSSWLETSIKPHHCPMYLAFLLDVMKGNQSGSPQCWTASACFEASFALVWLKTSFGNKSFVNKICQMCQTTALRSDWLFCFTAPFSLAEKKIRFRAKSCTIRE